MAMLSPQERAKVHDALLTAGQEILSKKSLDANDYAKISVMRTAKGLLDLATRLDKTTRKNKRLAAQLCKSKQKRG